MKQKILHIIFALLFVTGAYSQSMIVDSTTIIKVSFTGQHTYVSDLGFYLLAPGYGPGQQNASIPGNYGTVELSPTISAWYDSITYLPTTVLGCNLVDFGTTCNSGNDFNNFSFTSTLPASNPSYTACICDLPTPLTGNYASAGPWSTIYGFDAYTQGWGLQIYDCEPVDNGYLTTATVYFISGADTVKYIIPIGSYPINDGACDYAAASYFQLIQSNDSCNMSVNYTSIDPSGSNTMDGSIDITVAGGTPPYQYIWNNGTTTEDLNQIPFGTYSVDVFDNNQCSQSLTISLVDSSTSTSSCQAYFAYYPDSINMGDTGPYAFFDYSQNMDSSQINVVSWYWSVSGGGTSTTSSVQNPVFYLNTPGYYSVCLYIITADSCSSSYCDTIVINGTNPCNITIDYTYVMPSGPNSMDGSIDITVSGGTPPYQYVWNNGVSTQDLNQVPSGVYTVNVYDNNQCSQSITVNLIDSSSTSLYAYTDVYNETSFGACDGMVAVYPIGGTSPYQYVWSNGASTQYIDSLCMGTYTVTIYDAMQDSFVINAYVYYDSTNTGSCYSYFYYDINTNTQNPLTTYNFYDYSSPDAISWSWSFGDGGTSIEQNPMHVFPDTGVYSVCLTIYTIDSCVNTYCDNIFVSGDSIIINPCNMYVYGYTSNCSGANVADGAIDITVTGGIPPYSYNWTSGNGSTYFTEDLNNITFGNYNLEVYDANGCVAYQQFYVNYGNDTTVYCNFYAYSDITPVSYIGANDGVIDVTVVGGTAPYSFYWDNGATTEDLIGVSSGTYMLTIFSADSLCPAYTLTASVFEPYDPNGGVIIDSLYTNNVDTCFISSVDSFYVSGVNSNNNNTITVIWEFVVGGTTYVIDATYTCTSSGNYVIYLTINCGSNKGLTTYMTYIHTEITTTSPALTNESGFSLFPNPVKEKLNILFNNIDVIGATLNIYNISGQVVYSNNEISNKTEVNTSNLTEGIYIVKIVSNNNQYVSKFIK